MTSAEWAELWAHRGDTPHSSAELNALVDQTVQAGIAAGGLPCCGTTGPDHEPFCTLRGAHP